MQVYGSGITNNNSPSNDGIKNLNKFLLWFSFVDIMCFSINIPPLC